MLLLAVLAIILALICLASEKEFKTEAAQRAAIAISSAVALGASVLAWMGLWIGPLWLAPALIILMAGLLLLACFLNASQSRKETTKSR